METEKLYYADPYLKEFDAEVLSCEPGKDGWLVTLDRTAFYPEGGGQPADHGVLGGLTVTDVHEKDGVIRHLLKSESVQGDAAEGVDRLKLSDKAEPSGKADLMDKEETTDKAEPPAGFAPGSRVHGILDWDRRFDHMQQHSGEHIVSGMLCSRFDCSNVGFHMGEDFVVIDYDKPISKEQLKEVEEAANRYISEIHAFEELWPTSEELEHIDYRSKKELSGKVRITRFPGADCYACCGTHVRTSAEVGFVKLFSVHAFREGVRIEMMSGARAFKYLSACYEQNILCSQASSSKPLETGEAVAAMKQEIIRLKGKTAGLESKVIESIAAENAGKDSPVLFFEEMEPDALRRLTVKLGTAAKGRILVFAGGGDAYSYAVLEEGGDLKNFVSDLNHALDGRGGGRGGYAQGSLHATQKEIREFLSRQ